MFRTSKTKHYKWALRLFLQRPPRRWTKGKVKVQFDDDAMAQSTGVPKSNQYTRYALVDGSTTSVHSKCDLDCADLS